MNMNINHGVSPWNIVFFFHGFPWFSCRFPQLWSGRLRSFHRLPGSVFPTWSFAEVVQNLTESASSYVVRGLGLRQGLDVAEVSNLCCLVVWNIFHFFHMGVSINGVTPESSILVGFSLINHPFGGTTIYGNPQMGIEGLCKHVP